MLTTAAEHRIPARSPFMFRVISDKTSILCLLFPALLRPDTFSLGVCNGCQLMALLGWIPGGGLPDTRQPRFVHNTSGRFECRWATVRIEPSPSVLLKVHCHSPPHLYPSHHLSASRSGPLSRRV